MWRVLLSPLKFELYIPLWYSEFCLMKAEGNAVPALCSGTPHRCAQVRVLCFPWVCHLSPGEALPCGWKGAVWGNWGRTGFCDEFIYEKFVAELRINSELLLSVLHLKDSFLFGTSSFGSAHPSLYPSGHLSTFYEIMKFWKRKIM